MPYRRHKLSYRAARDRARYRQKLATDMLIWVLVAVMLILIASAIIRSFVG